MTRKRGWGAGGSSGTSLSAHSGQASDGQFMNHLRSPNCGCCTPAPIKRDGDPPQGS
jgi:hypothetical protein